MTTPRIAASLTAKRRQWQELANGSVRIELCAWCASEINHTLSLTSVPATRPSVLEAY